MKEEHEEEEDSLKMWKIKEIVFECYLYST